MRNRELAMTLQAAGLPAHVARAQARRIARMMPRPQPVAPLPVAPPLPIGPEIVLDGDRREIGTVEHIAGLWRAATRVGVSIGKFATREAATEALRQSVERYRRMARGSAR